MKRTTSAPWFRPASLAALMVAALVAACGTTPATPGAIPPARPVTLVAKVDLARYAGAWYVIAAIPTSFEDKAFNSKETYVLEDGKMLTTFTFNDGSFDGLLKTYTSTGYVLDTSNNAVWGQQYVWPIKADYRISYLSSDYQHAVVTREKRDYVWVLARTPQISDADYQRLVAVVVREGYDAGKLRKMPQAGGR